MSEKILEFGKGEPEPHLLAETAKACYVMARPILNSHALWYYPACFFVLHHSIESFVKSFLLKEGISFQYGQKGHELIYLLELGNSSSGELEFFGEILKNETIKDLLSSLDEYYNANKYWEVGFNAKTNSIIDVFDELISIFTNKFHEFYGNQKTEASIDVPEELVNLIERGRKYQTTLCILPKEN